MAIRYHISEIVSELDLRKKKFNASTTTITSLLTDSRKLSNPAETLFFALVTKTNNGHNFVLDLYIHGVRNFVVSTKLPEWDSLEDANFL